MSICAEIAQNLLRSTEWPLGVNDPVVTEETSEPGAKLPGSASGARSHGTEGGHVECVSSPARNLPRKTRLRTLTGRKKERVEAIQRAWSGARPPAAITQWTWDGAAPLVPGMEHAEETDLRT